MTHFPARFLWLVLYGDTTVARAILGTTAALWSAMLFIPGDTFERPVYVNMALFADETTWAWAWGIYAAVLLWRTFATCGHRLWLTLSINVVGVCLFGGATTCILFARVWPLPAAISGDVVLSVVSLWLLMRSGINNPPGWRND